MICVRWITWTKSSQDYCYYLELTQANKQEKTAAPSTGDFISYVDKKNNSEKLLTSLQCAKHKDSQEQGMKWQPLFSNKVSSSLGGPSCSGSSFNCKIISYQRLQLCLLAYYCHCHYCLHLSQAKAVTKPLAILVFESIGHWRKMKGPTIPEVHKFRVLNIFLFP